MPPTSLLLWQRLARLNDLKITIKPFARCMRFFSARRRKLEARYNGDLQNVVLKKFFELLVELGFCDKSDPRLGQLADFLVRQMGHSDQ